MGSLSFLVSFLPIPQARLQAALPGLESGLDAGVPTPKRITRGWWVHLGSRWWWRTTQAKVKQSKGNLGREHQATQSSLYPRPCRKHYLGP